MTKPRNRIEARQGRLERELYALYLTEGERNPHDPFDRDRLNACGMFPHELHHCPYCGNGFKRARGWTWISPGAIFTRGTETCGRQHLKANYGNTCALCPMGLLQHEEMVGLLWVGRGTYPNTAAFMMDAMQNGASRRIGMVPKKLELGKTWVLLAHPDACGKDKPGVFYAFQPRRVEVPVTEEDMRRTRFLRKYTSRGITPVVMT